MRWLFADEMLGIDPTGQSRGVNERSVENFARSNASQLNSIGSQLNACHDTDGQDGRFRFGTTHQWHLTDRTLFRPTGKNTRTHRAKELHPLAHFRQLVASML